MTNRGRTAVATISYLGWAVIAAAVCTEYGWYRVFGAAIPFVGGVFWVLMFALAAWGAGRPAEGTLFDRDRPTFEDVYLRLLVGTASLAVTIGLLALLHILRPTAVILSFGLWACYGGLSLYRRHRIPAPTFRGVPISWALAIAVAGVVSLAAATTLSPFYDQWHYHLGFPYQWLREGTVFTYPRQAYSFFPANMGLLYTYALSGPGGWGAQLIHWWAGALAAAGSAVTARRLGAPIAGQFLAAAVFAATPAVVQMGALAGSDLGVAAFGIGCLLLVIRTIQNPERPGSAALWAGIAAGFAAGCKYSALATVVLPAGIVAVAAVAAVGPSVARLRQAMAVGLAFALGAGIVLGPWLLRNALDTGNPFYPYLEEVFAGVPNTALGDDTDVSSGIGTFDFDSSKIETALTMGTFSRRGRAGDLGPIYLVMSPLVLWMAWRGRRRPEIWALVGYVALAIPAWAAGPPLGRYLFPVLAVVAALIGASWAQLSAPWPRAVRWTLTVLFVVILSANSNPARDYNLFNQAQCFLGSRDSDEYLMASCTQLEPFRAANAVLPPDAKILLVGEPRPFQIDRDVVVEDPFRVPLLVDLANQSASAGDIAARLDEIGVTHILWNSAEADRIAKAEKREGFLVCDDDSARARLDRFLSEFTQPVTSGEWWQIVVLSG